MTPRKLPVRKEHISQTWRSIVRRTQFSPLVSISSVALQAVAETVLVPPQSTFPSATLFDIPQRALCWGGCRVHSGLRLLPCPHKESDRQEDFRLPSSSARGRS